MSRRSLRLALSALTVAALLTGSQLPVLAATSGDLTGVFFDDADRDGTLDPGETPFAGLGVYVYDVTSGAAVGSATTAADGRYTVAGLAAGSYRVAVGASDWWSLRNTWVMTDLTSLRMERAVTMDGSRVADFPLRRILRSTTVGEPVTKYVAANGLTVESYNDVVAAGDIHQAVMRGYVGVEAPRVIARFDLAGASTTSASVAESGGVYSNYRAVMGVTYLSWLDNLDSTLSHEYGHAWSLYHAYITQQDPSLAGYVQARGLEGDSRVGSSYAWYARELIADDYRQLFGSATAKATSPLNNQIPPAGAVPGLREYLSGAFVTGSAPAPAPAPAPEPLAVTGPTASPAPVSTSANISFSLNERATVSLSLTDSRGRLVRSFFSSADRPAGTTEVMWDRRDASGRKVRAGSYTLRLTATAGTDTVNRNASVTVV